MSIQIDANFFLSLSQFIFTVISFKPVFFISLYCLYIHLYAFLSLVYRLLFLYTSLSIQSDTYLFLSLFQSKFTAIFFKSVFYISVYSVNIDLYLFLSLVYPLLFIYTSLSIQINAYLFLSLFQSKFTVISFKPVFFISLYSLYIHLYLFLSLVYPLRLIYTSLSIQIDAYFFLSLSQFKFTAIAFNHVYFISLYSLYMHLYLFLSLVYPLQLIYTSLSIQIDAYFFLSLSQFKFTAIAFNHVYFISLYSLNIHLYLLLSLVYPPLFLYISSLIQIFMPTSFCLFVNPNSRLYLLNPFSLSQPNLHISTCIFFYLFSIHHYLFLSLVFQICIYLFQSLSPNLSLPSVY